MIEGLAPYGSYKESGHQWLGAIPTHWELRKLKHLTRFVNGLPFKPSDWGSVGVPIIRIQNLNGSNSFNLTNRRDLPAELRIRQGDLLFAWSGNRGTSFGPFIWNRSFDGYLNQHIFKLVGYQLATRYFAYVLRTVTSHIEEEKTHGIIGLVHVTKPELSGTVVPLASAEEQQAIVRFLDHANRKIDRFIAKKLQLIALLNEQKQTIASHAVTRGLNEETLLKPSGIPWLGEIPSHWKVLRAKYVFQEVDERSLTGSEEQLSVSHLTGVTPRSEKNVTMFKAESYVGHKVCRPGDLAINTMWAWMAALGISKYEGIISPAYAVYRQHTPEHLLPEFADLLLRTPAYRANYLSRSTGVRASRLRLYPEEFLRISIVVPPLPEQQKIVETVDIEVRARNAAIARIEREITLMKEYRNRLAFDVVTGKLDVSCVSVEDESEPYVEDVNVDVMADDAIEDADVEAAMGELSL